MKKLILTAIISLGFASISMAHNHGEAKAKGMKKADEAQAMAAEKKAEGQKTAKEAKAEADKKAAELEKKTAEARKKMEKKTK